MGALRFWYPRHAAVLYSSMHIGRLTKVKTLYSIMTEKQRKMAYKMRTYKPSFTSSLHLFRWIPSTCAQANASHQTHQNVHQFELKAAPDDLFTSVISHHFPEPTRYHLT